MNVLFVLRNCKVCRDAKLGVTIANPLLPLDKQIEIVDIFSGDPRCSVLEEIYKSRNIYDWYVPVLVLDEDVVSQVYSSFIKSIGKRIIIHSTSGYKHYAMIIRNLM